MISILRGIRSLSATRCELVLQELGHVAGAEINGREVVEKFFLGKVEYPVVGHDRIERALHFRVAIPSRSVVVEKTVLDLAFPPRIPDLEQIDIGTGHVVVRFDDGVRVIVHHAVGTVLVGHAVDAGPDDVVFVVPSAHAHEELLLGHLPGTAPANIRPRYRPHRLGTVVRRIRVPGPLPRLRIELGETSVLSSFGVLPDRVLVLAPRQQRPGVRALPALDFVPAAAVRRQRLFEVRYPQLAVL